MELTPLEKAGVHMTSSFLQITAFLPFSHPIDTLKSRRQTLIYKEYSDAIKHIKRDGILVMYKGFVPMYINLISKQPAKLAVYEHITNPLYAGLATGVTGLIVGIPMSYIKTNYQVNPNFNYKSLFKFGISGFAKSFVAWKYEAGKEVVGNASFYGLYKVLNKMTENDGKEHNKIISFVNGFIAGFIGTYLSYPIDTMKSHKQTINQTGNFNMIFNEIYYCKRISPENINVFKLQNSHLIPSYTNFWRGVLATAIKHSVIGGVGMLTYESIKRIIYEYVKNNK
jgi:hypothetical protein